MVAGFLKDYCMKPTTGGRDDVGRISARRAWIPLKERKSELMVHEVDVSCGNGTKTIGLGLPKIDHGKNHCPWFGKEACVCTKNGANRVVGSRLGGTGTPFGAGSCAYRVCSHLSGTDRRLQGMAGRAVNVGEQVRISSKLRVRDWLYKSRRWLR